jgi:general secretion pathway protein J
MPLPNKFEHGFTLLEVLVGLSIAALIMLGLNAASATINRGFEQTKGTLSRQSTIAAGIDIISGDISRILRVVDNIEKPSQFLFSGNSTELVYLIEERPRQTIGEVQWVKLAIQDSGSRAILSRMRAPYESGQLAPDPSAWHDEVALIEADVTLAFSYRATRSGIRDWLKDWRPTNHLPEQIRVEIIDRTTGRLRVPSFVQSLKIDAEPSCTVVDSPSCTIRTAGTLTGLP